jgi:hypothetical protein
MYIISNKEGISVLVQVGLFIVFYSIYNMIFGENAPFTHIISTSFVFAVWLFVVIICSNLSMALSVPLSREVK